MGELEVATGLLRIVSKKESEIDKLRTERDRLRDEMICLRDDLRLEAERFEGMFRHFYKRVNAALQTTRQEESDE